MAANLVSASGVDVPLSCRKDDYLCQRIQSKGDIRARIARGCAALETYLDAQAKAGSAAPVAGGDEG